MNVSGILNVDKPPEWTSYRTVAFVRGLARTHLPGREVRRAEQHQAEQDVDRARADEEQQPAVDQERDDEDLDDVAPVRDEEAEAVHATTPDAARRTSSVVRLR